MRDWSMREDRVAELNRLRLRAARYRRIADRTYDRHAASVLQIILRELQQEIEELGSIGDPESTQLEHDKGSRG
jgi:hypothetical protein